MNKNSIYNGLKAPCKDCPDRALGCHDTCKKYLTYKKKWDYLRAKQREKKRAESWN